MIELLNCDCMEYIWLCLINKRFGQFWPFLELDNKQAAKLEKVNLHEFKDWDNSSQMNFWAVNELAKIKL